MSSWRAEYCDTHVAHHRKMLRGEERCRQTAQEAAGTFMYLGLLVSERRNLSPKRVDERLLGLHGPLSLVHVPQSLF